MIKQNPDERFSIDTVITELKFIYGNIKKNLQEIKGDLIADGCPYNISKKAFSTIIKKASEDILFATSVFQNNSIAEIRKYNFNWHMKIGYTVDHFLFNLYMQEKIFTVCKSKFDYESNSSNIYTPINISNNEEQYQIFQQFKELLENILINNEYKRFDLTGRILKYFTSCCDYHCKEILAKVRSIHFFSNAEEQLLNTPILWIVGTLKETIHENIDSIIHHNLANHIQINWDWTRNYKTNTDQKELFDSIYIDEENKCLEILSVFSGKWKISYNRIDSDNYSIKFKSFNQYDKFRQYAIGVSKEDSIFEGDVLYMFHHYDYANGIVELKMGRIFVVPYTLARVLGLRND